MARFTRAILDGKAAQATGSKLGETIAREAAIALARALPEAGDISGAKRRFAAFGPPLARLQIAVLAAALIKTGQLKAASKLCSTVPRSAPAPGAK